MGDRPFQDFPVLRWVFNGPGLVIWLMGLAVLFCVHRGDWKARLRCCFCLFCSGERYLLGPVMQGGYLVSVCLHAPAAAGRAERGETERDGWGGRPGPGKLQASCFQLLVIPAKNLEVLIYFGLRCNP